MIFLYALMFAVEKYDKIYFRKHLITALSTCMQQFKKNLFDMQPFQIQLVVGKYNLIDCVG